MGPRCAGDPGGLENEAKWSEEGRKHRPRLAPSAKGPRALELRGGGVGAACQVQLVPGIPGRPAPEWGWGGASGEAGPASP